MGDQPMQEIYIGLDGKAYFKSNDFVTSLVKVWGVTFSELDPSHFSNADRSQVVQLLGRSVEEWSALDYVSGEERAIAKATLERLKQGPEGWGEVERLKLENELLREEINKLREAMELISAVAKGNA